MISIRVRKEFLDKTTCREEARKLLAEGTVKGMSEIQLAREIYFHALVYYNSKKNHAFHRLISHSDPIDINDGGDTRFRRMVYYAFWRLPKIRKRKQEK